MRTHFAASLALLAVVIPGALHAQWSSQQVALLRPDPFVLGVGDDFGSALDLDGPTLVVGAHWHDPVGGGQNDGGAWVWRLNAGVWSQEAALAPAPGSIGRFGLAVAVDGDRIAVGAPFEWVNSISGAGAVHVFTRVGGVWTLEARLTAPSPTVAAHFGQALALEGDVLAIGAPRDDQPGFTDCGAAYVFRRINGAWSQEARLTSSSPGAFDYLGASIALSGARVAAGAALDDVAGAVNRGSVVLFESTGGAWSESALFEPADGAAGDEYGTSVAIDGDTLVVGAPFHDALGTNVGAAYVYRDSSGVWTLEAKLSDIGATFVDNFGAALDLEGDRLAVGLPYNAVPGVTSGAVQFFTRSGSVWTGHFDMIGSETDGLDYLGSAVALSGSLVAAGAPGAEPVAGANSYGEAYVFEITAPPTIESYCTAKTNSLGCAPQMSWSGVPSTLNPSAFDLRCEQVLNAKWGLLFYGFAPTAAPFDGGWLCAAPPLRRTALQYSGGSSAPVNDCSGSYSFDMNAWIQSGVDAQLAVGVDVWTQYWMRDPQSPSSTGLSDSIHFEIAP